MLKGGKDELRSLFLCAMRDQLARLRARRFVSLCPMRRPASTTEGHAASGETGNHSLPPSVPMG